MLHTCPHGNQARDVDRPMHPSHQVPSAIPSAPSYQRTSSMDPSGPGQTSSSSQGLPSHTTFSFAPGSQGPPLQIPASRIPNYQPNQQLMNPAAPIAQYHPRLQGFMHDSTTNASQISHAGAGPSQATDQASMRPEEAPPGSMQQIVAVPAATLGSGQIVSR